MKTVEELLQMQQYDIDNEEDTLFVQFRDNIYDQKTLRQFSTKNFWTFMEDFWVLIAFNTVYSKEFIIQMFGSCNKKEREQIDRLIHDQFSCLWDDLRPDDSPYVYMQKIMKYKSYIINAGYYLKYCKNEFKIASGLYQFFEENLNICLEQIIDDYYQIDFLYKKRIYD